LIGIKSIIGKVWHGTATKSINNAAMAKFLGLRGAEADRATRPFEQVGAVNRCIRMRTAAISGMPLMVSTPDDELVESGEIIDLLNQPWPGATDDDLVSWIDALVMLTGACYLVVEQALGQTPTELRPAGRDTCRPQYDADGELTGYKYTKPGDRSGRARHLSPDEVIPFTLADYQSQKLHDGLSQLKPTMRSIQQVYGADTANLESLYNGVEPGLVFDFGPNTTPSDEQIDLVYKQLDENHRSPMNRNRPIVIGGGATVQDFVKKFTEMEFTKLKSMSIVDVCVSLGVPPLVAGYAAEAGLGHGKELEEAHSAFMFITVLPAASWIARKLTVHLLPRFQHRARTFHNFARPDVRSMRCPTYKAARSHARRQRVASRTRQGARESLQYFAWFDSSAVDAVRDASLRRLKEATILTEKLGATQAEVIEAYDAPISAEHPWQKTWWKPMGLIDVQEDNSADLPGDGSDPDAPPDGGAKAGNGKSRTAENPSTGIRTLSDAQRAHLHELWWNSIQPLVGRMRKKVTGHFRNLRAEVNANLNRVEAAHDAKAIITRDLVAEVLFDLAKSRNKLLVRARPIVRASYLLGGAQSMEDAAVAEGRKPQEADPFNLADPLVESKLRARVNRVGGVTDTVYNRLKNRLAEAVAENQPVSKLREIVKDEFDFAGNRAATIARTEVGAAVEEARHEGRKQAGVPLKSWLWSRRETGRENHMQAERQTHEAPIAVAALFVLPQTGNTCQHPRATNDPQDDINCGCTTLSRYPDDAKDARLLAHRMERGFLHYETLAPAPAPGSAA
jgi:HK97 family phage portal protein